MNQRVLFRQAAAGRYRLRRVVFIWAIRDVGKYTQTHPRHPRSPSDANKHYLTPEHVSMIQGSLRSSITSALQSNQDQNQGRHRIQIHVTNPEARQARPSDGSEKAPHSSEVSSESLAGELDLPKMKKSTKENEVVSGKTENEKRPESVNATPALLDIIDIHSGRPNIRAILDEEVSASSGPVKIFGELSLRSLSLYNPSSYLNLIVSGPLELTDATRKAMIYSKEMYKSVDVSLHIEKFGYAVSLFLQHVLVILRGDLVMIYVY